jgi:hypothetical protein
MPRVFDEVALINRNRNRKATAIGDSAGDKSTGILAGMSLSPTGEQRT